MSERTLMSMQKGVTYGGAIGLLLMGRPRGLERSKILEFFAESEHANVGIALDEMVVAGDVSFDRVVYKLQARR